MATTPAKKTTAPKATTKKSPAKKDAAAPKVAKADRPAKPAASAPTEGETMRTKDLILRVAEATGGKPKDVREMVEATLAALGASLDAGEALVLPPLGRMRIIPAKAQGEAGPIKIRLHRSSAEGAGKNAGKEALAEGGEDS